MEGIGLTEKDTPSTAGIFNPGAWANNPDTSGAGNAAINASDSSVPSYQNVSFNYDIEAAGAGGTPTPPSIPSLRGNNARGGGQFHRGTQFMRGARPRGPYPTSGSGYPGGPPGAFPGGPRFDGPPAFFQPGHDQRFRGGPRFRGQGGPPMDPNFGGPHFRGGPRFRGMPSHRGHMQGYHQQQQSVAGNDINKGESHPGIFSKSQHKDNSSISGSDVEKDKIKSKKHSKKHRRSRYSSESESTSSDYSSSSPSRSRKRKHKKRDRKSVSSEESRKRSKKKSKSSRRGKSRYSDSEEEDQFGRMIPKSSKKRESRSSERPKNSSSKSRDKSSKRSDSSPEDIKRIHKKVAKAIMKKLKNKSSSSSSDEAQAGSSKSFPAAPAIAGTSQHRSSGQVSVIRTLLITYLGYSIINFYTYWLRFLAANINTVVMTS